MAKVSFRRHSLEALLDVWWRALILRRPILPWEVSWFPTYVCNLRCGYCNSIQGKIEKADPEKCVRKIIELAPGSLSILGGEPYIIPRMVEYLETIRKALPNVFILMTTNAMVKSDLLIRSMPLIDGLCISMDGLGDFTRNQREGSDPDVILNNIRLCAEERKRLNLKTDMAVNSVVTRANAMHLPEFYQYIASIDPTILNFSQAMSPLDSPLSIGTDPELADRFIEEVAKLKGKVRLLIAGRLADGSLREQDKSEVCEEKVTHRISDSDPHTCYQEKFNSFLSPSGKVFTCRSYSAISSCRIMMQDHFHKGEYLKALDVYWKHWKEFVIQSPLFECTRFIGCPEWMNDIMNATSEKDLPIEIFRVRGRLSAERVEASTKFIKKHVNPEFKSEFLL